MLNIYYFDQDIGPVAQKEPLKPNFIQAKKIDELIPSLDDAYNPKKYPSLLIKGHQRFCNPVGQHRISNEFCKNGVVDSKSAVHFISPRHDLKNLFKKQLNAWKLKWHEMTLS